MGLSPELIYNAEVSRNEEAWIREKEAQIRGLPVKVKGKLNPNEPYSFLPDKDNLNKIDPIGAGSVTRNGIKLYCYEVYIHIIELGKGANTLAIFTHQIDTVPATLGFHLDEQLQKAQ